MTINIERRNAFSQAFRLYPSILEQFAHNNCWLVDPTTGEQLAPNDNQKNYIMQILMGQFFVRLVKTRARNGSPEMGLFGFETVNRYITLKRNLMPGYEIEAEEKYRKALSQIENNMAVTIFEVLATEAQFKGEFDEGSFWHDVVLAFVQNQKRHHPNWAIPAQAIITDHLSEFRQALAA